MYRNLKGLLSIGILVMSIAAFPYQQVWGADPLYSNSFDSGWGTADFDGGCYSYSFSIVSSPTRSGSGAAKVVNKGSENNSNCSSISEPDKHRAEIRYRDNKTLYFDRLRHPYWIGFSIFVPNDFPTKSQESGIVIVSQLLAGSAGPEFELQIRGGSEWGINRAWLDSGGSKKHQNMGSFPLERGVWTDWVIYRERSFSNNGVLRVWKNGKSILDFVGETGIDYSRKGDGDAKPYFKTGIYWGVNDRRVTYTLYFDDIRVAEGGDGYALVAPDATANNVVVSTPNGSVPIPPSGLLISVD